MANLREVERWVQEDPNPAVQLRYLRDYVGAAKGAPELEAAGHRVAGTGWGAEILKLQLPDGQWTCPGTSEPELHVPNYVATLWRLLVLADLGVTRRHPGVDRAVRLLLDRDGGPRGGFGGADSETCFTGNATRMLLQFGYEGDSHVTQSLDWLVRAQKSDGGWHCFPSEVGTLDCWEALSAFAVLDPSHRSADVRRSVERGAEFYLDRGLLQEGPVSYAPWTRIHYPVHYYYDFLVGLDVLTALGYGADPRLRPALELLESKRTPEGWWCADAIHPDFPRDGSANYELQPPYYPFVLEPPGVPSRWITIGALSVLRRAGRL